MIHPVLTRLLTLAGLTLAAAPALAVNVTFTGTVTNLCVLTLTTPGVLAMASDGMTLSSTELGGTKATLTVAAAGSAPTISFGAPTMTGPASAATAVKSIAYTSTGGAAQGYTSGNSVYTMNRLVDTILVDARATNSDGFVNGLYTITSVATCQQ